MGLITWLALQGLTVGLLWFLIASGLSLIFGLMNVLNFAHGALYMLGTYGALTIYMATGNFVLALAGGTLVGAVLGALIELLAIRPLYGRQLFQVLMTMGLILVFDEAVEAIWGPYPLPFAVPAALQGTFTVFDRPFPVYRLFIIGVGLTVWLLVHLFLTRSRLGIIVRAGVEDREMVQALGIDIRKVFTGVFALGGALAALGGAVAGPFEGAHTTLAAENLLPAFIVVVVGGLGSFTGSLLAAILVGLTQAFVGYYAPQFALAVNIALMAVVLVLRPQGLLGRQGG
ncbi:branched-chain amino acid transport system permease protein [Symbiobacterium terraclitae]|uniref:Branched-chain amino acid transport system permease protein n=1 Tax=Symbiobacterium terraclitae TaxID=557451 RepID=A0ABS4JXU6_9FIRM|nr:branched-chain amino acid ABC transporter permease [Symbiobacterium terraclitae]MBP2019279.1 branched-chain amino acid transport system permease protein [Symbiobacterium terraclitae]